MARIATYPVDAIPTINDKVIGTDVDNELITKNYRIGDILALVPGGSASVQSLNTLTGDLNLIGAGGISISASGTDITITGSSSGGGIQTIDGATGPDIDLAGKGGITITAVGNLINIDGSGISGGNPGAPVNGVQFNDGGSFGAGEFFTVDLKGYGNPAVNIGKGQEVKGQLNIFAGAGEGAFYGETRYYDAIGSGQFAAWATPGQISKQSYAVALPENEPATGQVLVIDKAATSSSPYTSLWTTVSGGSNDKFKYDSADTQAGFFSDKVSIGSGLSGSVNTDAQGVKTLTISAQSVSTVNSIKVGSSSASGTFGFEGSGVTMRTGGPNEPQQIVDFDYQDILVSGTNIKTVNGNSLLGGGNLAITATATPGGAVSNIQFHNANGLLDGDSQFTYNLDSVNKIATVKIGNETSPSETYGVLRLDGNSNSEGGRVEFRTGSSKSATVQTVTVKAPDAGVEQVISLPETLPTATTQVLGLKAISGTDIRTEWVNAGGGTSLPYTSYEANFSVTANTVLEKVLSNTTGLSFGWIDNTQGQLIVKMGGLQKEVDVLVLLNGYGGAKGQIVQCFFGGYNKSQAEITIDIMDQDFVNQNLDITQGNIEIRVY